MNGRRYRECVGAVVTDGRGRVLVGLRAGTPDGWQMPQGGVDDGEPPERAVMRELFEETGIETGRIVAVAPPVRYDYPGWVRRQADIARRYDGQRQTWFLIEVDPATVRLDHRSAEFDRLAWVTPAEAADGVVEFKRAAYRDVFLAFDIG